MKRPVVLTKKDLIAAARAAVTRRELPKSRLSKGRCR